jgi:stage II sporulation protein D
MTGGALRPTAASRRRGGTPLVCLRLGLVALAACGRPQPAPTPAGPEPELRVGLGTGQASVRLGGDGALFVTDDRDGSPVGTVAAGAAWTVLPDSGGGLVLVRPDGSRTASYGGISAVNVTAGRFAAANGRRYRGRLNFVRDRTGLTLINRVPLESYVAGVLREEMGTRRPDERQALLAQAVVARTFALRNRGRWEASGYDATADTRDQVYTGVEAESDQGWDAVRATMGEVLRYHGQIIDAYYHSTCGGRTASAEETFRTAPRRPYLRSVSDASGGGHYYCEISPRFRWSAQWDGPTLRAILTRTLTTVMPVSGDGLPRITDVQVTRTTPSGRVAELRIAFAHGDVRVEGPEVRTVLRPALDQLLLSTAFQVFVTRAAGEVTHVTVRGAGSGHGVGMCQWGAIGRARAGQRYRQILATYFPGTTVDRLY